MTSHTPAIQPFVITRDEAPKYWLVDSLWSVLATAETTGGELTVLDQVMPKRSGPPPHDINDLLFRRTSNESMAGTPDVERRAGT